MPRDTTPELYSISADQNAVASLVGISFSGAATQLFQLGSSFDGGIAAHPASKMFYAIASDANGFSTLYSATLGGTVTALFGIGKGFRGGLVYRYADRKFYAIQVDSSGAAKLCRISLKGASVAVQSLGLQGVAGLAYDPAHDLFYALATDNAGYSSLYRFSLQGAPQQLFGVGFNVRGGLAYHAGEGVFYAIANDQNGYGTLQRITLTGGVRALFGVGSGFSAAGLTTSPSLPGNQIWIRTPLPNERFVRAQPVAFEAAPTLASASQGYEFPDGANLVWRSSKDGVIGHGASFESSALSAGSHTVTVRGYGLTAGFLVRVYRNLWKLYQAAPAAAELDRICGEFEIEWQDGPTPDQQWATYDPPVFDQTSWHPSKIVALARLDILRRQRFSKPLPFAGGKSVYDDVRRYTKKIICTLGTDWDHAGGGSLTVSRGFSKWDFSLPDQPGLPLWPYVDPLAAIVHENRHNEPGEPNHTTCPAWCFPEQGDQDGMDATLDDGSGRAWGAIYLMWVYKYALGEPPSIRQAARTSATAMLRSCFCARPQSANPDVQAIVDELLGP